MPGKHNFDQLYEEYTPQQIERYKQTAKNYFIEKEGIVSTKVLSRLVKVPRRIVSLWITEGKWFDLLMEEPGDVVNLSEKTKEFIQEAPDEFDLTERERVFCYHYMKTFNATNSAIRAGYTPQNGHFAASHMLNKPNVKAFLNYIKAMRDEELFLDSMDIVKQYMKIAFADMTDYVRFKGSTVSVRSSEEVDGSIISELSQSSDGSIKIKLEDRMKALEKLSDYLDVFPDNFKRTMERERLLLAQKSHELDVLKTVGGGQNDKDMEGIRDFIKATSPNPDEVRRIFDGDKEEN